MRIILISSFFLDFLYESVCGKLATTTAIRTPAEDSQETKNVQGNLFASISAALSISLETISRKKVELLIRSSLRNEVFYFFLGDIWGSWAIFGAEWDLGQN